MYKKQADILGWDAAPSESARTGTLRGTVLKIMGTANDPAVVEQGFHRFMELTKASSLEGLVSGDIQQVLFRLALRHDETTVFRALQRIYEEQDSLSPETKRHCLVVMGCVKDPKLHAEMMDYIFFSGKVCKIRFLSLVQNKVGIISSITCCPRLLDSASRRGMASWFTLRVQRRRR